MNSMSRPLKSVASMKKKSSSNWSEKVILQRWILFAQGYLGHLYPTEVTACKSNLQFSHKAEEEVENKGKQTHSRDKKLLKACLNH